MAFPPHDPAMRGRLVTRFGPSVAPWLDALPAQAAALAARWQVVLGAPLHVDGGSTSVVVRGVSPDGAAVVLKLTPEPALARAEGDVLAAGGAAFPRLLGRDDDAGALLMEAIVPGASLGDRHEPPDAAAVGSLLRRLRAVPAGDGLPPLHERVAWCFDLFERRNVDASDRAALRHGRAAALRLAADWASAPSFVHGDLHAGNVLDGGAARGLVAIDPRPCAGDPGFDAADLVLWGVASVGEAERQVAAVAAATGYDAERLRAWCAALAAMAAVSLAARPGDAPRRTERLATLRALAG